MRPLRIEVEGFTAFRHRTEVSFVDTELFALVGPTGAGKSSVIDAMVFALYGKVPRYQDDRAVAPVINAQSAEARVRLDFELEGEEYSAVRVVRRTKTGATTKEARLEHGTDVLAGDARSLDDAVVALLGLSFEQFTKTVVLPQGDFARFLHERPADRQELLVRLLDLGIYGDMASRARERAKSHADRAAILDDEVIRLGGLDTVPADEHRARAVMLGAFADELRDALAAVVDDERRLDEIRAEGEVLRTRQRLLLGLTVPEEVHDHQAHVDAARDAEDHALLALDEARAVADAAAEALAAAPDEVDRREIVRAWTQLAARSADDAAGEERRIAAVEAQAAAAAALARHAAALAAAGAALERAQQRARSAALRHELHLGEPCPVCEQPVGHLPEPVPDRELDEARRAHRAAAEAHTAAHDEHERAARSARRAEDEVAGVQAELGALRARLLDAPSLEQCERDLAQAAEARAVDAAARKALQPAEQRHRAASSARREAETRGAALRRALTAARDQVAGLDPPAPAERDLVEDWAALVSWAGATAEAVTAEIEVLLARHGEIAAARDVRRRTIRDAADARGVDGDHPRLLEHLAELAARATADADAAEARAARLAEVLAQVEQIRSSQQVADDLARLLGANGFQQWLLEEALDDLVAGASERMRMLSSGQFSLERDGKQFAVRDHRNADDLRPIKTLSGGETFLASLSLALALADNVAALSATGAPRLESMFLDEGFGSLDPETLDVVASAIEELGASGRMVGVVTHIRELADRLPVRYEVRKLPDGSVVERIDR